MAHRPQLLLVLVLAAAAAVLPRAHAVGCVMAWDHALQQFNATRSMPQPNRILSEQNCPDYANTDVCCSADLVNDLLDPRLQHLPAGLEACPACLETFQNALCATLCDPNQDKNWNVTGAEGSAVEAFTVRLNNQFAHAWYNQCRWDRIGDPGTSQRFDLVFPTVDDMLEGSLPHWLTPGVQVPLPVHIEYGDDDGLEATYKECADSCVCATCESVCKAGEDSFYVTPNATTTYRLGTRDAPFARAIQALPFLDTVGDSVVFLEGVHAAQDNLVDVRTPVNFVGEGRVTIDAAMGYSQALYFHEHHYHGLTTLRNINFANGRTNSADPRLASAVVVAAPAVQIFNCAFLNWQNWAMPQNVYSMRASPLSVLGGLFTGMEETVFHQCAAADGGAVHVSAGALTMTSCQFVDNQAFRYGGSVCAWTNATVPTAVSLVNCTVLGGNATDGGAIAGLQTHLALDLVEVAGTHSELQGGAVYLEGWSDNSVAHNPELNANDVRLSNVNAGRDGGGFYFANCAEIAVSKLTSVSTSAAEEGGLVSIHCAPYDVAVEFDGVNVQSSTAPQGGAFFVRGCVNAQANAAVAIKHAHFEECTASSRGNLGTFAVGVGEHTVTPQVYLQHCDADITDAPGIEAFEAIGVQLTLDDVHVIENEQQARDARVASCSTRTQLISTDSSFVAPVPCEDNNFQECESITVDGVAQCTPSPTPTTSPTPSTAPTLSPTPTPTGTAHKKHDLTRGQITGVVASIIIVFGVAAFVFVAWRRRTAVSYRSAQDEDEWPTARNSINAGGDNVVRYT